MGNMTGAFNYESIQRFVEQTMSNRGQFYDLPNEIIIPNRNCRLHRNQKSGQQSQSNYQGQSSNQYQDPRQNQNIDVDAILNDPQQFEAVKRSIRQQLIGAGGFQDLLTDDQKLNEFVMMQLNYQRNL